MSPAVDVRVCVLMCVLSYVTSADSKVVTVAILAALLSLLGVASVVFLKRKTLVRLLFTDKKSTMEKLRYGPRTLPQNRALKALAVL